MKNILPALAAFILFISCINPIKKSFSEGELTPGTRVLTLTPKPFIHRLPAVLHENSGIILWDSLFWTINDSGGENIVYAFDFLGEVIMEIEIEGATNKDWEEIAQDENHIYIGDMGNNFSARKDLKIYSIKKKDISKEERQKVAAKEIEFTYGNQDDYSLQRHSGAFDCEAMVAFNDLLYLFTKDWKNQTTTVYSIPPKEGKYTVEPIDSFNVTALITGADISPDGTKLALSGYKNFKPVLWYFSGITDENIFGTHKTFVEMDSIYGAQTEGVCFWGNDSLFISCEGNAMFEAQVFLFDVKEIENNGASSD